MTHSKFTRFEVRYPRLDEMDKVFMMGFDTWNEGQSKEDFLASCHSSKKYTKGQWYVLTDSSNEPVSKLIVYPFGNNTFGIGSIATPPPLRGMGFASKLVAAVVNNLEQQEKCAFFLFSDIQPEFYEKLGFHKLPAIFQKYQKSVLMASGRRANLIISDPKFSPPEYF